MKALSRRSLKNMMVPGTVWRATWLDNPAIAPKTRHLLVMVSSKLRSAARRVIMFEFVTNLCISEGGNKLWRSRQDLLVNNVVIM